MKYLNKMFEKTDPHVYEKKDSHLHKTLRTRDFLALGVGMVVSTAIFTLPGIVAAKHAGPAVSISFIIAAIIAGFSAMNYAEMASAMPYAGSAFSWINVLFGHVFGWIVGWALLAEYLIATAFISSGLSANLRGLLSSININLPNSLANSLGVHGGIFDLVSVLALLLVFAMLHHGDKGTAKVENSIVVLKVIAILLFVVVGFTAIHFSNYVPFIPAHHLNTDGSNFGGVSGIVSGISMIFISYLGFDAMAADSAEAKDPKRTMPRGIIGSLIIASTLFIMVSLVLVGMYKYPDYANNAQPVGWALRMSGHVLIANVIEIVATLGMLTALIGTLMAGSRLVYSFGRDGMLPKGLSNLNSRGLPENALIVVTIISIIIGSVLPFNFLTQLVSAGTMIAFMFVAVAMYTLHHREGKDIPEPEFRAPGYPVTPILALIGTLIVFWNLGNAAKIYALGWFIFGLIIYLVYGIKHSINTND